MTMGSSNKLILKSYVPMLVECSWQSFVFVLGTTRKQTLNSFGLGYRLVGTDSFKDRVLTGAQSLYDFRYDVRPAWQIGLRFSCPFGTLRCAIYYIQCEQCSDLERRRGGVDALESLCRGCSYFV